MSWELRPFGEIAEFRNGVNYVAEDRQAGIGLFNVRDFQDRVRPDYNGLDQVASKVVPPKAHLHQGDILFVRSNGNKELIGRSLFLNAPPPEPVSHSAFTIRARITSDECYPQFYALYCRSGAIRRALSNQGSGTNISNLNQDILARLPVPIVPYALQRRIADILSAYDDLIENNTRRIAILEDMARRLFEEWFVRSPEQPSWPEVAFTDIASVGSGGTPKKDNPTFWGGEIAFFTPRDAWQQLFAMDTLAKITGAGLAKCNSKLYPAFTVFITARGTVGNVLLAPAPMAMNQSCYALTGLDDVPQSFLFFATRHMADELRAKSSGAVFDAIIVDTFRAHSVKRPPLELMQAYDRQCLPLLEGILALRRANTNLRTTRDLLLPKLISGEIEVRAAEEELETATA